MNGFNKIAIVASFVLIFAVTLFPLNFTFEPAGMSWNMLTLSSGSETLWEMVTNGVLYIPLGLGISVYFRSQGTRRLDLLIFSLLICFALSYATEVLQSFLPSRYPSWRDVGANTLGGIAGYLFLLIWERKSPPLALVAYLAAAGLLMTLMQRSTTLNNWNTSFPLMVGNEHTGDRAWKGSVSEFYIASKAAPEYEIRRTLADKSPLPLLSDYLVAYYEKSGSEGYRDEVAKSPPLERRKSPNTAGNQGSTWFETVTAPHDLTKELVKSSQFTLGAIISSESGDQTGPARIISLSADVARRNFTLGQEGPDLIFRLTTPGTGENGVHPYLRVPSVFSTPKVRHIIITYDGTNLHVYIDGQKRLELLELTPALFLYNSLRQVEFPSSKFAQLLYYGIIFVPVGVMLLLTLTEANLSCDLGMFFLLGGVLSLFLSLALEGLLMLVSGRQGQVDNVLLGMFFCYFSVLGLYFLLIKIVPFPHSVEGHLA